MSTFKEKVLTVVSGIPAGQVLTYGQVAKLSGRPGAARAVGQIMKNNFDPSIPCHRVVAAGRRPGGYNQGVAVKISKLKTEGVDLGIV